MAHGVRATGNLVGAVVAAGGVPYNALILAIAFQESAAQGGIALVIAGSGNGNAGIAIAFGVGHGTGGCIRIGSAPVGIRSAGAPAEKVILEVTVAEGATLVEIAEIHETGAASSTRKARSILTLRGGGGAGAGSGGR